MKPSVAALAVALLASPVEAVASDQERERLDRNKQAVLDAFKRCNPSLEVVRMVAESDCVIAHVHKPSGGASVNWFRLDADGNIVEHWDALRW